VRCPVVLPFITKQAKVLFNFLVLAYHFAIILEMIDSSETGFNTKALVEGSYKMGSKLQTLIREDFLWNSMKAEYIRVMNVSGTLGCKVRLAGHKVALIQIVIDIDANGFEAV
jgi:hypothetical protein